MCCRVNVDGVEWHGNEELFAVLRAAGMRPHPYDDRPDWKVTTWRRDFADGKSVSAHNGPNGVELSLIPTIKRHTLEDHRVAALLGAYAFELAATLGRRFNTSVRQMSLTGLCEEEVKSEYPNIEYFGHPSIVIATPEVRMDFGHICYGFRTVLYKGVNQTLDGWEATISEKTPSLVAVKA